MVRSTQAEHDLGQLGRYRLVERLGAGGMAVVYRALVEGPEGFQRSVVIKRVLPELTSKSNFGHMLATEARLCSHLHHPNIIQVLELGKVDEEFYMAMEYVDGTNLRHLLARCRDGGSLFPVGLACYVAREVAAALAYAHDQTDAEGRPLHIVHRDVSPANIMVARAGHVKLLDFGVAKMAAHLRFEETGTGVIKGKAGYLSPEQASGLPVDHRSDIFSLGIVLYEMLTYQRPFDKANPLEGLRLLQLAEVQPPSKLRADIDPALDALVLKMLARDRESRHQRCDDLVGELSLYAQQASADSGALRRFIDEVTREAADVTRRTKRPASSNQESASGARIWDVGRSSRPGKLSLIAAVLTTVAILAAGWVRFRGAIEHRRGRDSAPMVAAAPAPAELARHEPAAPPEQATRRSPEVRPPLESPAVTPPLARSRAGALSRASHSSARGRHPRLGSLQPGEPEPKAASPRVEPIESMPAKTAAPTGDDPPLLRNPFAQ